MVLSIHYLIGLDLAPHAATIACSTMELSTNARVGYLHFFYFHILLFDFGEVSGFTRCDFVGKDGITRTKWVIPDALKKNAYLKDWKYPASHSKIPCIFCTSLFYTIILIYEVGSTAAAAGGAEAVKDEPEVDDKTPEDEVPVGQEMYPRYSFRQIPLTGWRFGMVVAMAGTKKDLGMSQDELTTLIEEHGGEVTDNVEEANFMIATEAELTKRYNADFLQGRLFIYLQI